MASNLPALAGGGEGQNNMALIRIHKSENYTVMCNNHLREKQLSLKAMGLMSLMLSLPDNWEYSISGLTKMAKDGKDSVMNALTELENFGYLKRIRRFDERGRFAGFDYDIFEQPQTDSPYSGNPNTEKPYLEKPYSENPPQINTNIPSTNELNTYSKKESKKEGRKEDKDIARARESYDEIIEQFKVPESERAEIIEFIRHCQLNGHTLTNYALYRNLENLSTYRDERSRSAAIHDAIDKGLFRIPPSPELHYDEMGMKSWSRAATYEDIINDSLYGFDDCVKSALWDFIAYRQANGRKLTNDGHTSLCQSLIRQYKPSESSNMVKALQTAMERGYMTIKDGGSWIAETVQAARERGMALIGDDCG